MATRQYIGARYVPKFDGVHDSTKAYEPLTIVTDAGATTSYTSKKMVPVGIALNNTEYWVVTGTLSGAVIDLQGRVGELETDVDDLQGRATTLESDVDNLNTEVGKLTTPKNQLLLFGDSWADKVHDPTNVIMPDVLASRLNCTVYNYAYGGTGFDVEHGYDAQLDEALADPNVHKENIKYIILVAGLNEYNNGTTYQQFVTKLQDWYSKARAKFGANIPIYWFHNYSLDNGATPGRPLAHDYYTQYHYYANIIRGISNDINCCLTFGWVAGNQNLWQTSNWYHLTQGGQAQFVENMIHSIEGTPVTLHYYCTIAGTLGGTAVLGIWFVKDDYLTINIDPPIGKLVDISTTSDIIFSRPMPSKLDTNVYIGQGCITQAITDKTRLPLLKHIPNDVTATSNTSGRYYHEFRTTSF